MTYAEGLFYFLGISQNNFFFFIKNISFFHTFFVLLYQNERLKN